LTKIPDNDGSPENLDHIILKELRRYDQYICKELPLAATKKLRDTVSLLPVAIDQEVPNLLSDAIRDAQLQLFQGYMERRQLFGGGEIPHGCSFVSEIEGPYPPLELNQGIVDQVSPFPCNQIDGGTSEELFISSWNDGPLQPLTESGSGSSSAGYIDAGISDQVLESFLDVEALDYWQSNQGQIQDTAVP
jgi:hypothetical protein